MRKYVRAAHCCQEANPDTGTGGGSDQCSEAATSNILCTLEIGAGAGFWSKNAAEQEAQAEGTMKAITKLWNAGATVSALEPESKIVDYVRQVSGGKIMVASAAPLTWSLATSIINRQHIAVIFLSDYSWERSYDGSDPVAWPETEHAGHFEILAGYDEDFIDGKGKHWGPTLIICDPLRAYPKQPWDYQYQSIKNAVATLAEVLGPALPYVVNTAPQPAPAPAPVPPPVVPPPAPPPVVPPPVDPLAALQAKIDEVKAWLATAPEL